MKTDSKVAVCFTVFHDLAKHVGKVRLIPGRIDITQRPAVVNKRTRLGEWEGDTVHGQNAHLVTLVDRTSRFTLVQRIFRKTKEEVANAMIKMFSKVHSVLTVTLDNGGEFADHARVAKTTNADVYFAKPYANSSEVQMRTLMDESGDSGLKNSIWRH